MEIELDQIQEMESLGYLDHYQWCQKHHKFLYRYSNTLLNGEIEPRERFPKGSKELFALFNLAPELSQYPKRNKSISMMNRKMQDKNISMFGYHLHKCYLKYGTNIGYTITDFNALLDRDETKETGINIHRNICKMLYALKNEQHINYDETSSTNDVIKIMKYIIDNLNNPNFISISTAYHKIIEAIKLLENKKEIGTFILSNFNQLLQIKGQMSQYYYKFAEIWVDSPIYMIENKKRAK